MDTFKHSILIALTVAVAGAGCARHETVTRRQARALMPTPAEVRWGPAAEGIQCRLKPVKRACPAGESPAFNIDLCNRGDRVFAFLHGEQAPVYRFAIDGRWRRWPEPAPADGRTLALGPGVEVLDLPAALPADARPLLTNGRHVVQFAFSFEGIEVISNAVEIEIVGPQP